MLDEGNPLLEYLLKVSQDRDGGEHRWHLVMWPGSVIPVPSEEQQAESQSQVLVVCSQSRFPDQAAPFGWEGFAWVF